MAEKKENIDLIVRVRLEQNEKHDLPEKLPKVAVHAFDENGEHLSSAEFEVGDAPTIKAKLKLPRKIQNKVVRLALGAPRPDIFRDVPLWMKSLIGSGDAAAKVAAPSAEEARTEAEVLPTLATFTNLGAREKRVRVTAQLKAYDVALHPHDWLEWIKCSCEVQGRLIRRVPMPDGTSKEVGICHACVLIYEVDGFARLVARLPDRDLLRLREDLWRLKEVFELPPKDLPVDFEPPFPPRPPRPFRPGLAKLRAEASRHPVPNPPDMPMAAKSRSVMAGLGPQPEPPDMPAATNLSPLSLGVETMADLDSVLTAGSAMELRNSLIAKADIAVMYACYLPWLYHWYHKDLIRCVCTDEDGRFSTTITYTCSGDKPDLYFKAVQCIGGSLHTLYDPGVACHTHWNYVCGTDVILETTDPAARVCAPADPVQPPPGTTPWIMPYGIGGIRLDRIDDDLGVVDYVHPVSPSSSISITGAPFGGTLGFRLGHSSVFPAPGMTHYRWLYKHEDDSQWREFAEPVASAVVRHYVDEDLTDPSAPPTFPAYQLGPQAIGGKHLYEFKPDEPPQLPDHARYWPTDNWFNDIYSGILRSRNLPGGIDAAAGRYKIKLEIYDSSGTRVAPAPGTFRFIVPTGLAGDGKTILTRDAYDNEIVDGEFVDEIENDGFVFHVHIDNRSCDADIDGPTANGSVADDNCGFLRYGPTDQVNIGFHATHPDNFAYFHFWIRRGTQLVSNVGGEVGAASVASSAGAAHNYSGDGFGNFVKTDFTTGHLLGSCSEAAFAEILRTKAKATNGWNRLHIYDAGFERAFALAPETP